jgi:50S ribosomal protein L16 3-hydroxylase
VEGMPVKLLANFQPTEEWLLEPGDMLYLPPRWGHDGVAVGGDCMTCSIGFRTPTPTDLAREVLQRMTDALDPPAEEPHYRDPAGGATAQPGLIPEALQSFAAKAVIDALNDANNLACALGEALTEPKSIVWFEGSDQAELRPGQGVRLDARSRMMYDARHVFINGESFRAAGRDARLMHTLADTRRLGGTKIGQLSDDARGLVQDWLEAGWLRGDDGRDD